MHLTKVSKNWLVETRFWESFRLQKCELSKTTFTNWTIQCVFNVEPRSLVFVQCKTKDIDYTKTEEHTAWKVLCMNPALEFEGFVEDNSPYIGFWLKFLSKALQEKLELLKIPSSVLPCFFWHAKSLNNEISFGGFFEIFRVDC